jgi:hypothetical protein
MTVRRLVPALACLLTVCTPPTYADDRAENPVIEAPRALTIRSGFGIGSQSVSFDIREADLSNDELQLNPNVPLHWIIGAEWRRIGLSARIKLPTTVADLETRGKTEFTNFQFHFFGDRNAFEFNLQQHTGMYISNANEFDEEITDTRLPDFRLTRLGASYFRTLNPRHSLAAAYKLNAWNERSTGSTILLASYDLVGIESPRGPAQNIPAAEDSVWSGNVAIVSNTISVGAGYAALLTYRNAFVAPLGAIALGAQQSEFWIGSGHDTERAVEPSIFARLSAGVNGPRWIAAMILSVDVRVVQTRYLSATQGSQLLEFVIGRRFELSRWRGTRGIEY